MIELPPVIAGKGIGIQAGVSKPFHERDLREEERSKSHLTNETCEAQNEGRGCTCHEGFPECRR
jgi:hypothetical protein